MKRTNFYTSGNDTIQEIQSSFSHFYPGLEINFFSNSEKSLATHSCVMFSPEVKIRDISSDCCHGCIELNDQMTVTELENLFQDNFNLHAEISLKSEKPARMSRLLRYH